MNRHKNRLSLLSRGLRHKLRVAFYLMSVIPLAACIVLFNIYYSNISQNPFSFWQVFLAVAVSFILAAAGFVVAKQIVDPIVDMSSEIKSVANGDLSKQFLTDREDEIGDLSQSLNQLVDRIRNNMEELSIYSEKTQHVNYEINRRVVVLSGLLEISSLISKGANIKDVFEISVNKLTELQGASWTCLVLQNDDKTFSVASLYGLDENTVEDLKHDLGNKILDCLLMNRQGLIINSNSQEKEIVVLRERLGSNNMMFVPIFRHTKVIGFLGVGALEKDTIFKKEDLEVISVFSKQIAIGIESEYLTSRLQKLEIKDVLTGLYNKTFIVSRLQEEIRRAVVYQRPCAFVILSVDKFREFSEAFGGLEVESTLKKIAGILESNVSDIDRVARYGDSDFAVVLPDKNKKHSVNFANQLRIKVSEAFSKEEEQAKRITICGAVSENPLDGAHAQDLIDKAEKLLDIARQKEDTVIDKY